MYKINHLEQYPMKVVVQNGCEHALSRSEVESIIPLFPDSWKNKIKSIGLYQGKEDIETDYYPKQKQISLFSPKDKNNKKGKEQAICELLIALYCVTNTNKHLQNLSKSVKQDLSFETQNLRDGCLKLIFEDEN